jgi:hypothetical protein
MVELLKIIIQFARGSGKLIEIVSAFLTPIIGVTTVTILVLQYYLARRRWRLDLYDKRYPVYLATMQYLSFILQSARVTDEELFKFLRNSKDKEFLFGKDVQQYLDELYRKGVNLNFRTIERQNERIEDSKRRQLIKEEHELLEWFSKQFEVSKKLFGEYLTIDKK